jgi:hypothetical protein
MSNDEKFWFSPGHREKLAPRQLQPGELLFEFCVERTKKLYRVELRDHGEFGVEAQFLDPVDIRIARTFHQYMDLTRSPRAMAIQWAEEERKAIEQC